MNFVLYICQIIIIIIIIIIIYLIFFLFTVVCLCMIQLRFLLWYFLFKLIYFHSLHFFCRWTKQTVVLENPTDETLELTASISNANNFYLERDNERPIILDPHSKIEVCLHFMPSTLGEEDHTAQITFTSRQVSSCLY